MSERLKVLVACAISPFSGYGNDGIGLVQALVRSGADVYVRPPHVAPPLPAEVAQLFTKGLATPFDLLIDHQDPGLFGSDQNLAHASKVSCFATMWEMSTLDNQPNKHTISKRARKYNIFLPYDSNTSQCFDDYLADPVAGVTYVETLQGGYTVDGWEYTERDWNTPGLNFCMLGQLSNRKNVWATLDAWNTFQHKYADEVKDCTLHLKSSNAVLNRSMEQFYNNLRIYNENWTTDMVRDFYGRMHVLLAPSRGEGKNLPALEMMTTGGAVVATNWGGHTEWLNEDIAYPLNEYSMVPVDDKLPECKWSAVDPAAMAEVMIGIVRDRETARQKGILASKVIPATKSWDTYVQNLYGVVKRSNAPYAPEVAAKIDALTAS